MNYPQVAPFDLGRTMQQANQIAGGQVNNQTALLQLQDLQRQQEAQAALYRQIQADPSIVLGGAGAGPPQSILGGLHAGGPGAITQSPMPGMPGQAQTVPAPQDLSQFATGTPTVTPPQSTLGALGPPPRPDPVRALLQENPQAGLQLLDMQAKRQEQHFKMRGTVAEGIAVELQGATDQASYDAARQRVAQISPQWAQALPQVYSKEAVQPWIDRAIGAKEYATQQIQGVQAQAAYLKARREQANIPNYTGDAQLDALIYVKMKDQPPGTMPSREIIEAAYQQREADKLRVQKAGVTPQIVEGEGGIKYAVDPHTLERRPIPGGAPGAATPGASGPTTAEPMRGPMTEGQSKTAGYTSRMQTGHDTLSTLEKSGDYTTWKAPLARWPGGRMLLSDKQKEYETAKGVFLTGLLRYDSAGQITETEWKQYGELYFPEPDDPPKLVEFKNKNRAQAIKTHQEMLGRPLPGQQAGGQSGTQGQPTSQGTPKPVGEMSREDIAAEIAAIKKRGGS